MLADALCYTIGATLLEIRGKYQALTGLIGGGKIPP